MKRKPETKPELIAAYSLQGVLILTMVLAAIERQWIWMIGGVISVIIGFLPQIIHKDVRFTLPWQIGLLIAIVAGLNMGGFLMNYYYTIPWYGNLTEFLILVLVALICFALVYILDESWDGLMMDRYAMAFLVVVTTMAATTVLEFIKFLLFPDLSPDAGYEILFNLFIGMAAGIVTALIGVACINKGKFDSLTDDLKVQVDDMLFKKDKKK